MILPEKDPITIDWRIRINQTNVQPPVLEQQPPKYAIVRSTVTRNIQGIVMFSYIPARCQGLRRIFADMPPLPQGHGEMAGNGWYSGHGGHMPSGPMPCRLGGLSPGVPAMQGEDWGVQNGLGVSGMLSWPSTEGPAMGRGQHYETAPTENMTNNRGGSMTVFPMAQRGIAPFLT